MTEPHEVYPCGGTGPPPDEDELLRLGNKAVELDEGDNNTSPDPAHADPADETRDPADYEPGQGDDPDAGELPADIPETDQTWPPGEGED